MTGEQIELIAEFSVILFAPIIHTYYLWRLKKVDSTVIYQNIKIFSFLYALVGVGIILLLIIPIAQANDSHCYSIKNSDQKNYCLALAKHQDSYCYSIQESDTKNLCLAQIKNQKSYCYSIKASDSKNQCLAVVK